MTRSTTLLTPRPSAAVPASPVSPTSPPLGSAYTMRVARVFHIDTLNPAAKGKGSYEGAGLSVSVDPAARSHITPLGGQVWRLSRRAGRFADFHDIRHDPTLMAAVWAHAETNGYVTRAPVYYVYWLDGEDEEEVYDLFLDRAEAEEQRDDMEDDDRPPRLVMKENDFIPTPAMGERALYGRDALSMRQDFAILFWVEDTQPLLDGVWYDDDYDPYAYSCPRGVIFPGRLDRWARTDLGPASDRQTFIERRLGVSSDFNT